MDWYSPKKPAEIAESRLIQAILTGKFSINSNLPAERELAELIGVTRPTLREALQRLERDGWLEIHQGKTTRIRNFWEEGNLGVLSALAQNPKYNPQNFVLNLLSVRIDLAPSYTRLACENNPVLLNQFLGKLITLPDDPQTYTQADWTLHHQLTIFSANPIYTLILNGFRDLYLSMGLLYFSQADARLHSSCFYKELLHAVNQNDPIAAEALTHHVMSESLQFWQKIDLNNNIGGIP
ncbi:MAG: fatty acid metabolism transcriptional regulator FadR [Chloroflexota bacterium]